MSMVLGGASVALVEFGPGGVEMDAFKSRLEMVLALIDHGAIGGNYHGSEEHKAALDVIEAHIGKVREFIAEEAERERAASTDARRTLTGVAERLVSEMEDDNGCTFFVSEPQAARLNELCSREPATSLSAEHISILASGEHSEQLAVLEAHRYGGEPPHDVDEVSSLLNDIFEG